VEALSVSIQVLSFKLFHNESSDGSHPSPFRTQRLVGAKIIVRFWIISSILAAAGFTIFYMDLR